MKRMTKLFGVVALTGLAACGTSEAPNAPSSLPPTAAVEDTATFQDAAHNPRPLAISINGPVGSFVRAHPMGTECFGSCTIPCHSASTVTLFAYAPAGAVFTGWSGACSGTGVCDVRMNRARSVQANFSPRS